MNVTPGSRLGPYEVVSLLGEGGMGRVYRARDTNLNRDVALKLLPAEFASDVERLARFKREAQVLASLNHPHIAAIHGFEDSDGTPALVLELVEGPTLADRVVRGPMPLDEALPIARQIAEALEAAHSKGIVHRDLKPANIKLTLSGLVKVLDFGLAKVATGADADLTGAPTMGATREGTIVGTPAYMSPEQARGQAVDTRTDIWAFGCVLFEMLAGHQAFGGGESISDIIVAILTGEPDWRALRADIPAPTRTLLRRCLEKDRTRRLAHIADARLEIDDALAGPVSQATTRAETAHTGVPAPSVTAAATLRAATDIAKGWTAMVSAAAAVVVLAGAGYFYLHRPPKLTDKDTLVLADFTNTTGDPVFDGTLRQGLSAQLEQSPFLRLISDQRIQGTLRLMGQPADAPLTPRLAKDICERTASAAVLEGSIAGLGSQYVLGLRATHCRTGDILDEEQVQTARKEDVLNALSRIATTFRTRVGESLTTVAKYDTPLEEATTPSLEALKAFSAGRKALSSAGDVAALPLFKRAIEIDPKFATAYVQLARVYTDLEDQALAGESTTKAYELRDRVSDRERFNITAAYDIDVTGTLEKAQETCELWAQTYPRESEPHDYLAAFILPTFGKFARAVEEAERAIEIDPDFAISHLLLAGSYQALDRLEEAENALRRGSERKLEIPEFSLMRYDIAFLKADKAGMERQVALSHGTTGVDDLIAEHEAFVSAYSGHLRQARAISQRQADQARQTAQRERAALYETQASLREALFGNSAEARQRAMTALELSTQLYVECGAGVALALSGDFARSQAVADDLTQRFPEDTGARVSYLPALHALLALNHNQPATALDLLQAAAPYELGAPRSALNAFFGAFTPVYVRGLAYLAAHRGAEAAKEFQKILDHRGIVVSDPIGALARLQLGRAFVLSGDVAKAKPAYEEFLTLWNDADPDIPILKQAKAELGRLP